VESLAKFTAIRNEPNAIIQGKAPLKANPAVEPSAGLNRVRTIFPPLASSDSRPPLQKEKRL